MSETAPSTARERMQPYRLDLARATEEYGVDPFLLAGVILRESGFGWAPGYAVPPGQPRHLGWGDDPDGPSGPKKPHAFGLIQADARYHSAFIYSVQALTPLGQFRYACRILRGDWAGFLHSISFGGYEDAAWRCAVAAYNAGFGSVLNAYVHGGLEAIDSVTTGHDYSSDVYRRAEVLRGETPRFFEVLPVDGKLDVVWRPLGVTS